MDKKYVKKRDFEIVYEPGKISVIILNEPGTYKSKGGRSTGVIGRIFHPEYGFWFAITP